MKLSMIGAGGWGTAMVSLLAGNNPDVWLYCRNPAKAVRLRETRENTDYLPGCRIPESVHITSDLEEAVRGAACCILCTPSGVVEDTAASIAPYLQKDAVVVSASKGLASHGGLRLSQVIGERLQGITDRIVALSGPNHAEEVGRGLPAAAVAASSVPSAVALVQDIYMSPVFRVYRSDDIIGVEYGGALKNIMALACGVLDGMGLGDNSRAALMTRGLVEMTRFGIHFGAQTSTFFGLSGMGDLIATCTSTHSRNHAAGLLLAEGKTATEILSGTNMVVEGIRTAGIVHDIAEKEGIQMPITDEVYRVLQGEHTPQDALAQLMSRAKKSESEIFLTGAELHQ